MEAPKRLRDLLWVPALVRTGPELKDTELGEVLMPALCPFCFPPCRRRRAAGARHRLGEAGERR